MRTVGGVRRGDATASIVFCYERDETHHHPRTAYPSLPLAETKQTRHLWIDDGGRPLLRYVSVARQREVTENATQRTGTTSINAWPRGRLVLKLIKLHLGRSRDVWGRYVDVDSMVSLTYALG